MDAVGVAEITQALEALVGERADAAFALHRLDQDGRDVGLGSGGVERIVIAPGEVDEARQRELWKSIGIAGILVLVLLVSAWQHFELLQHGYRVEQMQKDAAAEAEIRRHLSLEIDTLRAPARIEKLATQQKAKGASLIPLKIYFVKGRAKVLVGVGFGRKKGDKREHIKEKLGLKTSAELLRFAIRNTPDVN